MKSAMRRKPGEERQKKRAEKKLVIAAIILFILGLSFLLLALKQGINNSIIFLHSESCAGCSQAEQEVEDIALSAGMRFYRLEYNEPGAVPGLVFIHHNEILITGYRDAESFKRQICGFTRIRKACMMAGEAWE